jgi:hypothetical protein
VRTAIARTISIIGHPVVFMSVAALIAASTHGAPLVQLRFLVVALTALAAVVVGYTLLQVRAGRWAHVDASARGERSGLNIFLATLFLVSAALAWFLMRDRHMPIALLLSALLIVVALLLARWVKVSLHAAFALFATSILWPVFPAVVAGAVMTAAVVWSRLALRRHVAADVIVGLALGLTAGVTYVAWVA